MLLWPAPTTVKELRGFLGLTGFYRKFVKGYASIASPLTELLKKDQFQWNIVTQASFDQLKMAMSHTPVLVLPEFSQPFQLFSDASGSGMGAVLMQRGHPIAFFSKKFFPRMQKASTYVRELHAITEAVKKWRHYLLGRPFEIITDQKSITELMTQTIQTPEQHFYLAKLLGYDYTISYKPGPLNVVADSLSRIQEKGQCLTLTVPHFDILDKIKCETTTLPDMVKLQKAIKANPTSLDDYRLQNGLILRKGRIVLGRTSALKDDLIKEYHCSLQGGHMGATKTYSRLSANCTWEGMRKEVERYVKECHICQQIKYETKPPAGLLQPIPPPHRVWEDLSLDFIVGLPNSGGYSTVLVVVDRFSKACHFCPLPAHFTAASVAEVFSKNICKLHGIPRSLISDRDPIFVSKFWKELFKLSGTTLRMSTAYHPESDGQTEVMNRVLQQYLRAFAHNHPSQWSKFLHWAEWSYNSSVHSATGVTPFEVVYGRSPPAIPQYMENATGVEAVQQELETRDEILQQLRKKLMKAQDQMKKEADKRRRDLEFEVGDWVYVKLRPYRQKSLSQLKVQKLAKKYFGPFQVKARIGSVAYELDLPPDSKIHPVFHCSILKKHVGSLPPDRGSLPQPLHGTSFSILQPLAILDIKPNTKHPTTNSKVLIQWAGLAPEDSSWEDWDTVLAAFPNLHLEDKVFVLDPGNDSHTHIGLDEDPTAAIDEGSDMSSTRPKRLTRRPAGWDDYAHN